MRHHDQFMRAFAQRRVPYHEVDDIVQAVFVSAWRKRLHLFAPADRVAQRAWLYGAARLEIKARYRAHERQVRLVERVHTNASPGHDRTEQPSNDVLYRSLARLSSRDRALIEAAYFDGLSSSELSAWLGCSAATARQRLARALEKLRARYSIEAQR